MLSQAEREAVVSTCRCTGPGFDTEQAGRGCSPRPQTPCCTDGGREGWCPHEVCGWHCKWARPYWRYRNHTVNGALSDTQRQQTLRHTVWRHIHMHTDGDKHTHAEVRMPSAGWLERDESALGPGLTHRLQGVHAQRGKNPSHVQATVTVTSRHLTPCQKHFLYPECLFGVLGIVLETLFNQSCCVKAMFTNKPPQRGIRHLVDVLQPTLDTYLKSLFFFFCSIFSQLHHKMWTVLPKRN